MKSLGAISNTIDRNSCLFMNDDWKFLIIIEQILDEILVPMPGYILISVASDQVESWQDVKSKYFASNFSFC